MKLLSGYFFSVYLFFPVFLLFTSHNETINFPVPPKSEDLLFYLQRTVNSNTVVYELNRNKNGEIDLHEPVKIQWIQYAKDSSYEPLNYVQRTFAYGINARLFDEKNKSFMLHFVSYNEKPLYLLRSAMDNKYHVYIHINNKLLILDKIFVQIDGGTYWFPEISYVEVSGTIPSTSEKLTEKIRP
jgi:hypothetical protein